MALLLSGLYVLAEGFIVFPDLFLLCLLLPCDGSLLGGMLLDFEKDGAECCQRRKNQYQDLCVHCG